MPPHLDGHFRATRTSEARYNGVGGHASNLHTIDRYNHIARQQPRIRRGTVVEHLSNECGVTLAVQRQPYTLEIAPHKFGSALGIRVDINSVDIIILYEGEHLAHLLVQAGIFLLGLEMGSRHHTDDATQHHRDEDKKTVDGICIFLLGFHRIIFVPLRGSG